MLLLVVSTVTLCTLAVSASDAGFTEAAQLLLMGLDDTANPCDNFYNYACGNWPESHNGTADFNSFSITTKHVLKVTGEALLKMDPHTHPSVKFPFDQAGIMMHNCMKGPPTPKGDLELTNMIIKDLGGWPSVTGKMTPIAGGAVGVEGLIYGRLGVSSLFGTQISVNFWRAYAEPNLLFMGQTDNLKWDDGPIIPNLTDIEEEYTRIVRRLQGVKLDAPQLDALNDDDLSADATEVARLEVKAQNATWQALNWTAPPDSLMQIIANDPIFYASSQNAQSAIQRWPMIEWPRFLVNIAEPDGLQLNVLFGADMQIAYPSYIDWVNAMLAATDERVVRNWLMFKLATHFENDVTTTPTSAPTTGRPPPTASACASRIMATLPFLVGRVYADESGLDQADMNALNEMIGLMLSSWRGMIKEVPWMSKSSKEHAFNKIDHNVRNVAWPPWIMNDAALADHYRTLNVDKHDDAFTCTLKASRWAMSKQLTAIGRPVDRETQSWVNGPAVVNAWYMPELNTITFPAAIMSSLFYNSEYPKAYNYGHMGAVMGHELGHAFDNNGVTWGPVGEYINGTWFDAQSKAGFAAMTKCVVDEYNDMCLKLSGEDHCVNGTQTLGENIADNGGLVASWRAFQAVLKLQGGEKRLPEGFGTVSKLTENQLFWLSFGNDWCTNEPDEQILSQMKRDPHSPGPVRVLGSLRNIPAFAESFNCQPNSYMAPVDHCHVWVK